MEVILLAVLILISLIFVLNKKKISIAQGDAEQSARRVWRPTGLRAARSDSVINNAQQCLASLSRYRILSSSRKHQAQMTWVNRFDFIVQREVDETKPIYLHEIGILKKTKPTWIVNALESRRSEIAASTNAYPLAMPKNSSGTLPAPPEPSLVSAQQIDEIARKYELAESIKTQLMREIERTNNEVMKAYQSARSAYDLAELELQKFDEFEIKAWNAARAEWEHARAIEQTDIDECLYELRATQDIAFLSEVFVNASALPPWVPREVTAKHDAEQCILIVEKQFPNIEEATHFKRVQLKNSISDKPLNQREKKDLAASLYPLITLKIATDLSVLLPETDVSFIVVNGWVNFRDKATGRLKRAFCSSLAARVEDLKSIDLSYVEPSAAFAALKGNVSRTVEITPIAPTVRINIDDPRFVDSREILGSMVEGENLAAMDWEDFEHLCRQLFEKEFATAGATVKVTQASRDQGVDAIITDPDPIKGGKIVIQAKRYINTVDVSAVRDLAGTVSHEGAMKGLLVTTSQFGPESYAFVQGKPLTLINGPELLYLLERNGYNFRIDLEEARRMQRESGSTPFGRTSPKRKATTK